MKKTKAGLAIADTIDKRKPLVKDFVDPDKALDRLLDVRLPYVSQCKAIPKLVFVSKDAKTYRYRVNWMQVDGIIKRSGYFEILKTPDGLTLSDKTQK